MKQAPAGIYSVHVSLLRRIIAAPFMHISWHKREEEKTSVSNSELTRILSPDSKEESTAPRAKPQERMPGIEMQACDTEWDSEEIKEGERELNRRSCARDRPSTDPARGGEFFDALFT